MPDDDGDREHIIRTRSPLELKINKPIITKSGRGGKPADEEGMAVEHFSILSRPLCRLHIIILMYNVMSRRYHKINSGTTSKVSY